MAIPIFVALAAIKAAGTGAGIAYSLYQRHKRQTDQAPEPQDVPTRPEEVASGKSEKAPKGPVLIMLDEKGRPE